MDWASWSASAEGAVVFYAFHNVQTVSGAHTFSYPMETDGCFQTYSNRHVQLSIVLYYLYRLERVNFNYTLFKSGLN